MKLFAEDGETLLGENDVELKPGRAYELKLTE
jgi:hypothetical protein